MTKPTLIASLTLALACASACGGRSVTSGEETGAGPNPASGGAATAGASSGGTSSAGGSGPRACRVYATKFRTGAGVETTCAFDRSALSLRCATSAGAMTVTTFRTIDAFVADNDPVGRFTHSIYRYEGPLCSFTNTRTYDEAGRPLADVPTAAPPENCGNRGATYLTWDELGRPLTADGNSVGSLACAGQAQLHHYDDDARRVEIATTGGTGAFCHDVAYTYTYDGDALPLAVSIVVDGSGRAPIEYQTLEVEEICR